MTLRTSPRLREARCCPALSLRDGEPDPGWRSKPVIWGPKNAGRRRGASGSSEKLADAPTFCGLTATFDCILELKLMIRRDVASSPMPG
jgi:hypothetical protein